MTSFATRTHLQALGIWVIHNCTDIFSRLNLHVSQILYFGAFRVRCMALRFKTGRHGADVAGRKMQLHFYYLKDSSFHVFNQSPSIFLSTYVIFLLPLSPCILLIFNFLQNLLAIFSPQKLSQKKKSIESPSKDPKSGSKSVPQDSILISAKYRGGNF